MENYIAQVEKPLGTGFLEGIGFLGNFYTNTPLELFSLVLSLVIGIITVIAFIWFLFLLITGAIGIMTSGGDKQTAENARRRIVSGLIGLIVVIAGIFIVDLIGALIGINILNPTQVILNFSPT
jgi:Type IV secretion system pilin